MSDTRKQSTQDKIDTVHVTAKALAQLDERLTGTEVADAIVRQVKLVHGDSTTTGTQST